MKPYIRWSKPPSQPLQLLCVGCGAVRPSLYLPVLEVDAVTRTFAPWISASLRQYLKQGILAASITEETDDQPDSEN